MAIPTLRNLAKNRKTPPLALELWNTDIHEAGILASMNAELAVHDKQAPDEQFLPFFPLIKQYAVDERNYVKKAVNWVLRQIGKRNSQLHVLALEWAEEIKQIDSKAAMRVGVCLPYCSKRSFYRVTAT